MSAGMLTLADVVEGLKGARPQGLSQTVSMTVIDSRQVKPGALFVALKGERADGHDYVADAFSRGAVAAIVERDVTPSASTLDLTDAVPALPATWTLPLVLKVSDSLQAIQRVAAFWRRQHSVRVVGITGSVGKTTTKELAAAVLARRYVTLKSEASYNNEIGLPLTLAHLTDEHERVVLEMGMYDVGEISDLARIAQPQVGVVTIIGPVHLERAGTIERIVEAKTELVEALPPAPEGVAILNYDDERVRGMAQSTQARVFYYGLSPQADLWADRIEGLGLDGIRFRLHYRGETLHVKIPLLGRHSVHTALRAAAVGLVESLTWQEVIEGLRGPSAQLRLVAVPGPGGRRFWMIRITPARLRPSPRSTCWMSSMGARSPSWATCSNWVTMSRRGTRRWGCGRWRWPTCWSRLDRGGGSLARRRSAGACRPIGCTSSRITRKRLLCSSRW